MTLAQPVHAEWPGGVADGLAEDVDEDGALLVRIAEEAVVRVEAGDVTSFATQPAATLTETGAPRNLP